ncbi:hypothetical protein ARZXY2_4899 (plasmid) [Arthrobacter sp. ZXY-2]|nr:hypothetical protein ARZXY2_4899 [Arthrobacter sp. ZXY-2]
MRNTQLSATTDEITIGCSRMGERKLPHGHDGYITGEAE